MKTTYVYDKEQGKVINKPLPMPRLLDIRDQERWNNLGLVRFMDDIEIKIYNSLGVRGFQDYFDRIKENSNARPYI